MKKAALICLALAVIICSAGCGSPNSADAQASSSSDASVSDVSESVTGEDKNPEEADEAVCSPEDAEKAAKKLYDYIKKTYKTAIISGQQESTWKGSDQFEFDYIEAVTGKLPAIRGLDYMNDDFDGVNKRAAEWYERGGIVTICWHCGSDFSKSWAECTSTEIEDWDKALTAGTPENDALLKGMDKAAEALKKLQDKGVPVLWRPFHEFDGAWFWWGKGGAENFKKLWTTMYDRYTNYHGLKNLIWVLGYSHVNNKIEDWYPGDEYVDIVGADSYNKGANGHLYKKLAENFGDDMPICFHECGTIPTVEELVDDNAQWAWFMTWHTNFITEENDTESLEKIYNDEYVITLDELPDLRI